MSLCALAYEVIELQHRVRTALWELSHTYAASFFDAADIANVIAKYARPIQRSYNMPLLVLPSKPVC